MLLSPYRVLDLTDDRGHLAGAILAQLGADVVLVEPLGGCRSRMFAPFAGDVEHPDRGVFHLAYNRGKRSVELDLAGSDRDREELRRLVAGADVLIESAEVGAMAALGLSYEELSAVNPALVYASITAFGQEGPRARWRATDLTVWASAGPLVLTGDADRPPVRPSLPQAFLHASAEAAGAVIAALYERAGSGHGQHVDVSAQLSCSQATQSGVLAAPNYATGFTRGAGSIRLGPADVRLLWPCKDGHVSITFLFGTALGPATARFVQWMYEEGYATEAQRDDDWVGFGEAIFAGGRLADYDAIKDAVTRFCADHTKAELLAGAMERRLLIAPVQMIDDVVNAEQFAARDFWRDVDGVRYPGPFAKLSATPLPTPAHAPALGADTAVILGEPPRTVDAPPPAQPAPSHRPLEGVKILDFMWVMAGPAATRVLADLGATVVRVESSHRIETGRTLQPFRNDDTGIESSALYFNLNAGKLGLALDPTTPEGRTVVHDLVRWADVVTESFSPRAMRDFGLDYESLRAVNPNIVMVSSCLFGQTGPLANFAGYGTMGAAMAGFFGLTGWPDRAPCGPFGAYTDYIAPRFTVAVTLAALDHRRRTGEGQYIDFAQAEAGIHALAPAVLEYTTNGRVWPRVGNDDPRFHPHGVFAAAGDDRWVALACTDGAQRAALDALAGGLDAAAITAWTSARHPDEAAEELQRAGVPAYAVQDSAAIAVDPQYVFQEHFRTVPHPVHGEITIEGTRFKMSRSLPLVDTCGPTLGQHTFDVLTGILGYDDERFTELLIAGAIE